jgi:Uma2 family endonuclease
MDPRPDTHSPPASGQRRATYQDLLDAPDDKTAEIIDGELLLSPRPAKRHARVFSRLGGILVPPFELGVGGPGGWQILDEPEIHLDDDIVVPDMAGWRNERAEQVDDGAFYTTAPDWVCEILSRSTEARDRSDKLEIYARSRVQQVWLIDPLVKTLETFAWSERGWITLKVRKGNEKVRAVPFEAIEIDLALLWA